MKILTAILLIFVTNPLLACTMNSECYPQVCLRYKGQVEGICAGGYEPVAPNQPVNIYEGGSGLVTNSMTVIYQLFHHGKTPAEVRAQKP